jgi:chloride channel 7
VSSVLPIPRHNVSLQVFNVHTLLVKFASCALAVGSGLPVGPEGPMVHIGAMVGAALSQGHSTTLGFDTGLFKRFQNPKDKRDFVTAGRRLFLSYPCSRRLSSILPEACLRGFPCSL